jgi:hypothetical protein
MFVLGALAIVQAVSVAAFFLDDDFLLAQRFPSVGGWLARGSTDREVLLRTPDDKCEQYLGTAPIPWRWPVSTPRASN